MVVESEEIKNRLLGLLIEHARQEPHVFYDLKSIEEFSGVYRTNAKSLLEACVKEGSVQSCSVRVYFTRGSSVRECYRANLDKIEELME
ncbi:hypothetical protein HOI26_04260 [Candidatus Woesearchaeota archaeon]|mgnify:CR=1 FL=1|nr:hypothetical protein [Candidatus Woesearchaeota archaeon]MBT5740288.1 hypothetical protein [Candidatus Woesearchaeota archaeon]